MTILTILTSKAKTGDLKGGTIQPSLTSDSFRYVSDNGSVVTLTVTGATYDANGLPTGGTVTGVSVVRNGVQNVTLTDMSMPLTQFCTLALGLTSGAGASRPDINALMDVVLGGQDVLNGHRGDNTLAGWDGDDTLNGNDGDDWLGGGTGVDSFDGGSGVNGVFFALSDPSQGIVVDLRLASGQVLDDGFGNTETLQNIQLIEGTIHNDVVTGPEGINGFYGDAGDDTLLGMGGSDTLVGGDGKDVLQGGSGTDYLRGGAGRDSYDGGSGVDEISFFGEPSPAGVVVNLARGKILNDGYGNSETVRGVEIISGSNLADQITGSNGDNTLRGNAGNDVLKGGDGDDLLFGGSNDDQLDGGAGNDDISAFSGADTVTGGGGADDFLLLGSLASHVMTTITDFGNGDDLLVIDSTWGGGFAQAALAADQLLAADGAIAATTARQRLIYDSATGDLYFDADGNGTSFDALHIATLTNQATLTAADFAVDL